MLLPDQTYEQASLRQECLRVRSAAFGGDHEDFQRLLELRELDVKQLQRGLDGEAEVPGVDGLQLRFAGESGVEQEESPDRAHANNEMKFGVRVSGEDGSGSSGVGSSTDAPRNGKHPEGLDVRLPMSMTNGGRQHLADFDADSLWSGGRVHHNGRADAGSHTIDARCRSSSSQRAPPKQPSRSDQTDRGIGLGSTSSVGSSGLSYSSDSSDEEGNRLGPEGGLRKASSPPRQRTNCTRRGSSECAKASPPEVPDGGSWAPDQGERDDYDKTSDFFNNIPEFQGEALGPFSLAGKRNEPDWGSIRTNVDILRACELFLMRHRMRPDFFCKYTKAMNPSASAPPSFPLSRSRTSIDDRRKPKSVSPPMLRTASRAHGSASFSRASATLAGDGRSAAVDRGPGPIYSVPNRAGKKRRPNADASSSNEAVHLQQRLKSLSSELVTLRNRLHTGTGPNGTSVPVGGGGGGGGVVSPNAGPNSNLNNNNSNVGSNHNGGGGGVHGGANHATHAAAGLMGTTVGANGINVLPHLANGGCPANNGNNTNNPGNNNNNNNSNNNNSVNINNKNNANNPTNNVKNHMLVTSAAQCIPAVQAGSGNNLNASQPNVNVLPIVSPRNTSIPYPLPHHNSNSNGTMLHGDTIPGGGTLPRRTAAMGFGGSGAQYAMGHVGGSVGSIASPNGAGPGGLPGLHGGSGQPTGHQRDRQDAGGTAASEMDDLIHLPGPLTEDAVMRTLHNRFNDGKYFTNVGPILLSVNPYHDVGNPLTLSSTRSVPLAPQLRKIVQEAVRQQAETGYPQAIILSGTSGSGKTHCSMLLLRQLFAVAGGGPETDAFKHLAAAFTVLRSLGSAKTATNSESSRIGQFIEVQVTDGALYRTKIHCYFLDQTRVIRPLPNEKNYHIFYQMLAGLNADECARLNLEGYSPANLRYLQHGDIRQDEQEDAARFQAWKACLGILGIPFLDVVRVLAAVLLLGNVQFVDGQGLEVEVVGETELNAVANLLGVPPAQLFRGLTTRTHNARGQLIKSVCDANMSNMTRDCLAKALYCRTVATIVRRANSLKRLGSTLGTLSSDSNESVHNQAEVASQHASTIGGNAGSKSMAALNNAVRHATDGFIGILDMFGFEEPRPAQLEHLCINLCAETMQHFYNTHIFKSSVESCREEGIICDTEVDYVDNVPCIDLISSLRTGLLSMLDAECSVRGTAESYVAKIKVQHRNSARLEQRALEPYDPRLFAIRHFAGRVEYDTTDFLDTNRDVVPDDLVSVFYKHTCNFGFATHLFGTELKALYAQESGPRGLSFRIAPTSHTDLLNGDEPVSTLTQDFHTRLDNLLRTLVHARPHFVRCIRSNTAEKGGAFDRGAVVRQIRALQVLETVNLMASGFPHRMRFKQFTARYRMLAPFRLLRRCEEKALEDCKVVLDFALENPPELDGSVTLSWAPGKRHIFLSEGIRQHLERLRAEVRTKSATLIQATWRGWNLRKRLGTIRRTHDIQLMGGALHSIKQNSGSGNRTGNVTHGNSTGNNTGTATRPRPQPIAGTPPPDPNEKCDSKIIAQTCTLFGLDLERPPPVPPSRSYTVTGNSKLGYPQTRIMKMNFPEDPAAVGLGEQLRKGEAVTVTGASHRRGHLIVEHNGISLHVPFQYMELVKTIVPGGTTNGPSTGAPAPPPPTATAVNI